MFFFCGAPDQVEALDHGTLAVLHKVVDVQTGNRDYRLVWVNVPQSVRVDTRTNARYKRQSKERRSCNARAGKPQ